jgi:membrane-bound ClpP family serine protease
LGEEYQSSKKYEWPVRKSAFAKLKEAAQKPDTYLDENGKEQVVEETVTLNGKEVKIGKVTDEEVAKVDELLNSVSQVMRYDTKVEEIITEESGAYFADQKSADEVARLIQNRVQTYLSESQ